MGGCCCCSSKQNELIASTAYYYYPQVSDEHVPLSSGQGVVPALSGGLLVDTNLNTSSPDTYRPPPAPIPFNATLGVTQAPPMAQQVFVEKTNESPRTTNSNSIQEIVAGDNHYASAKSEDLKESKCEVQNTSEAASAKCLEIELTKLPEPVISVEEEDACPICLEEYDAENPKLSTKCDHHFHLACILEWMERSENCPLCDQDMVFDPPLD